MAQPIIIINNETNASVAVEITGSKIKVILTKTEAGATPTVEFVATDPTPHKERPYRLVIGGVAESPHTIQMPEPQAAQSDHPPPVPPANPQEAVPPQAPGESPPSRAE